MRSGISSKRTKELEAGAQMHRFNSEHLILAVEDSGLRSLALKAGRDARPTDRPVGLLARVRLDSPSHFRLKACFRVQWHP